METFRVKKEEQTSLFSVDMIIYIQNITESTEKLLQLISKFTKVCICNQEQQSIVFVYISNKQAMLQKSTS